MTDNEINEAIAQASGWTEIHDSGVWHHHKLWGYPRLKPGQGGNSYHYLPDYCTDLNAMHEAEKVLSPQQEKDYFANIKEIVGDNIWYRTVGKTYRATARERAEAFLRTLGLWKEVQK